MHIYAEHRAEGRFWDARYADGCITITSGLIGGDAPTQTRIDCAEDAAQARLGALVGEQAARGYMAIRAPADRWQAEPTVAAWFAAEGLPALGEPCTPTGLGAAFAEAYGVPLPPELAALLDWRDARAFGHADLGEWRLDPGDTWLPDPAEGNRFEQLIELDQQNSLGTRLFEYFTACVPLGTAGNGDVYLAHLDVTDPARAEVIFWNHETRHPEKAFADGISTLAWVNHWYRAVEAGDFDPAALAEGMARVQQRASLTWHYSDLASESGVEPEFERQTNALYYFYRATWIIHLLQADGVAGIDRVRDLFHEQIHTPQDFEAALKAPFMTCGTVTALYWLWRLFWFDKADQLARCVQALAAHPSPVIRDAAALVAELQAGRKALGKIADVHALRARFIALDLDPERAAARAAEAAAAEAAAQAKDAEDRARALEFAEDADAESLAALAWAELDSPAALAVLEAALRPHHPEVFRRLDFLKDGGARRNNRSFDFENDEIDEILPRLAPWMAPFWLAEDTVAGTLRAARTRDPSVREYLEPLLDVRGDHHHRLVAAIEGLTALGARDLVPRFVAMLAEFSWSGRDFLAALKNKQVMWALCAAIGALGSQDDAPALVALAETGPKEVVPRALKALGQLGGDTAVVTLTAALDGPHRRLAIYALAMADPERAVGILEDALAIEHGPAHALAYERLMLQSARLDADQPVDLAVVDAARATIEALKYEDIELHQTLAAMASGLPERPHLAREAAFHPRRAVREAARRGLPKDVRFADRPTVVALHAAEGLAGLTAWLADPRVLFKHDLLRFAAELGGIDDAFAEATVAWFRADLGRFTAYTHGFVRDENPIVKYTLHALGDLRHPITDALLTELLGGPNAMYREIVRKYDRDERLPRPVARAEADLEVAIEPFGDALWAYGGSINGLAWSPDGSRLAVAGSSGVALFDADGAEVARCADTAGGWIYDVAWHPSGAYLAMGAHAGHLFLLDPATGETLAKLKGHAGVPNGVRKLRFSPDGARLASVSCDRTLRVWDVARFAPGESVGCVFVHRDTADVNGLDWLSADRLVIITDNALHFLAIGEAPFASIPRCGGADVRVDHATGRVFATAPDGIRAFDLAGNEDPAAGLSQTAVARLIPLDGALLAASWSGGDMGVSIWTAGQRTRLEGHTDGAIFGAAVQPTTGRIFAGGKQNRIVRWRADGALEADARAAHGNEVSAFAFTDDAIYTASDDGTVIEWAPDGRSLRRLTPSTGGRCCTVAVTADAIISSGSAQVVAFERATGAERWAVALGRSEVMDVFGDVVIAADYKSLIWIDLQTGERLHTSAPFAQSFMFRYARLDARRFVCAGYDDEQLYVWDAVDRAQVDVWRLPASAEKGKICGLAAGGGRLFATRWDKTLVVLDAATGRIEARVHLPHALLNPAASPDGSRLVAGEGRCFVYSMADYAQIGAFTAPAKLSKTVFADGETLLLGAASGALLRARLPG